MPREVRVKNGRDGRDGDRGVAGVDGLNGKDGAPGRDGLDGREGQPGPAGRNGRDGRNGTPGARGKDGAPGPRGPAGDVGPAGPRPDHEWSDTSLRFQRADGSWGQYVDLKGDKGDVGAAGERVVFHAGGGPVNMSALFSSLPGADDSTPEEIVLRQGGRYVRATWSQFLELVGATAPPDSSAYADNYADGYA